jgi:creatinine amidohydrolase
MAQIRRRDVLLAGLTLPAIAGLSGHASQSSTSSALPKRFEEIAGFEVDEVVSRFPVALLPLGSLEFHGPHNPLGSDSIIISGLAQRVAARTSALLCPTVTFTQCPAHTASFRGTISVRPEVMTMYFADILRNIAHLGFRKVFILNGHDGNVGPARGAIAQVADENNAALLFASWWEFVPTETLRSLNLFHQTNGGHGHGGPLETSAVAAFRPELVHLEKASNQPEPPNLSGGAPYFLQKASAVGWPGYSGNISEASAEKGKKIVQMSEDGIVTLIENWLKHDQVPGSW